MTEVKDMTDHQLESAWQGAADMISAYAIKSWHKSEEGEAYWHKKAEDEQTRQTVIQKEITRRSQF